MQKRNDELEALVKELKSEVQFYREAHASVMEVLAMIVKNIDTAVTEDFLEEHITLLRITRGIKK